MRTIKFRGKRTDTNEWVYGDLKHIHDTGWSFIFVEGLSDEDKDEEYMVIPETVGQFTGLIDENGTDVFECDILASNNQYTSPPRICEVYYCDEKAVFRVKYEPHQYYDELFTFIMFNNNFEVIGNIHDNPELLELIKK